MKAERWVIYRARCRVLSMDATGVNVLFDCGAQERFSLETWHLNARLLADVEAPEDLGSPRGAPDWLARGLLIVCLVSALLGSVSWLVGAMR